jgi:hypothetical protein
MSVQTAFTAAIPAPTREQAGTATESNGFTSRIHLR